MPFFYKIESVSVSASKIHAYPLRKRPKLQDKNDCKAYFVVK